MIRREQRVPAEQIGFFSSLVYPDYRRLWGATACSQAALWALIVLRGALVYELTKSNAWVGFVTMAAHLPSLIVTPLAGFLADRCERRQLLALTYGLNRGSSLLLACLVITRQVTEWHILMVAVFNGIVRAVEMPTNQALLPNLVPRERLLNAVALNQLMQQGARMFGPLCILPIIRFVNPEPAFFMSACLYAVGWLQILTIRTASRGTIAVHQGIFGNLVAGIRYIYAQPLILPLIWHYPDPGPGWYSWPRDERQYLARTGRDVWFQRHQRPADGRPMDDGAHPAARDRSPLRGHHAG